MMQFDALQGKPLRRRCGLAWDLKRCYVRPCSGHVQALSYARTSLSVPRTQRHVQLSVSIQAGTASGNASTAHPIAQPAASESPKVAPNALALANSLFAALNRRDVSAVLSLLSDDVLYENLGCSFGVLRGRPAVGRFYLEALAALPEEAIFVLEGPGAAGSSGATGIVEEGQWQQQQQQLEGPAAVEVVAAGGPILQAGVAWHVELNGAVLPLSRGVGVYWADPRDGRLTRILDNPEHPVKAVWPWAAWTATTAAAALGLGSGPAAAAAAAAAATAATAAAEAALSSPLLRGLSPLVTPAVQGVSSFLSNLTPGAATAAGASGKAAGNTGGGSSSSGSGARNMVPVPSVSNWAPPQTPPPTSLGSAVNGGVFTSRTGTSSSSSSGGGGGGGGGGGAMLGLRGSNVDVDGGGGGVAANSRSGSPSSRAAAASPSAGGVATSSSSTALTSHYPNALSNGKSAAAAAAGVGGGKTAAPAAAPAAATSVVAASSGEHIRMRALPEPQEGAQPPPPPGVSFASVDDDVLAAAAAGSSSSSTGDVGSASSAPAAGSNAAAAAAAAATGASEDSGTGSFASGGSVDDAGSGVSSTAGGGRGGGGGTASTLPVSFVASRSMDVNLSGLWEKDAAASQVQEYEAMLDVLELGGLQKVTARLIDGIDILHDEERFEVGFVTVVPFFRVTERSRFRGTSAMMRRDLRSGQQTAVAARMPGGVRVELSWGAPLAGGLAEEYVVSQEGDELAVTSSIDIGGRRAAATQIYRRSNRKKSDFLASKRSLYGSLEDVLRSQEKKYGKINY